MRITIAFIIGFFSAYTGLSQHHEDQTKNAEELYKQGAAFLKSEKPDMAIANYTKALSIYQELQEWEKVTACYNRCSEIYFKISDYGQALKSAQQALDLSEKKLDKDHLEKGFALANIGKVLGYKGDYKRAVEVHQQSLSILRKVYGDSDPIVARSYQDIRQVYSFEGKFQLSLEYDLKALSIYKNAYGEKDVSVGRCYFNIGSDYFSIDEHDEALKYYERAQKIYKATIGEKTVEVADIYRNIGRIYVERKDYGKVLESQFKGLAIYNELVGEKRPFIILFYWNIGDAYAHLGDPKKAVESYQKAITIIRGIFGEKHPGLVSSYFRLAEFYKDAHDYDHALEFYQRSLIANVVSFNDTNPAVNPVHPDYMDQERFYSSLLSKAKVLRRKYDLDKKPKTLLTALATFQLMDTLLTKTRQSYSNETDKIFLGKKATTCYEGAIESCLKLYDITREDNYRDLAFYFSEKNKAEVLREALSDLSAKDVGAIPKEMLALEQKLKGSRSMLQSKIMQAKLQKDTVSVEKYNIQFFAVNRSLDSLLESLEHQYPKYYKLKYQNDRTSIEQLRQQLAKGTAVIEYFEGDSLIYAFAISKNHFKIFSITRDSTYGKAFDTFHESIKQSISMNAAPADNYKQYTAAAVLLYKNLVQPFINDLKADESPVNLVVIPDGQLSYIPFEVLLTKTPSTATGNYADLDYLIKSYTVSYGYSAALNFGNKGFGNHKTNSDYLSFAPVYNEKPSDKEAIALGKFRGEVSTLKWNQREVENLSKKIGGSYYEGKEATEARFKQEAPGYKIIHLAMHALADDQNPMNSKLVFTQTADSVEDGYLHAFELYNMQLNADLVVLSACNTGYGKLSKGEGIMSLGRAFSYAGVPAIVMSHWKVDDEATSKLMQFFYENLAAHMSKSEALQKAKLKYLMDAGPAEAHPFFWAAFVTVGDDSSVIQSPPYAIIISLVGLALTVGAIVFVKKRKKNTFFAAKPATPV